MRRRIMRRMRRKGVRTSQKDPPAPPQGFWERSGRAGGRRGGGRGVRTSQKHLEDEAPGVREEEDEDEEEEKKRDQNIPKGSSSTTSGALGELRESRRTGG